MFPEGFYARATDLRQLQMIDIYLTPELKAHYMNDFNALLEDTSGFWSIDNPIKGTLTSINSNPNIQTLYSKYPNLSSFASNESYVEFAYSLRIELKLLRRVVSYFTVCYNKHGFIFTFQEPSENANVNGDEKTTKIGARDDNNYFKINHVRFEIDSTDMEIHRKFWIDLESQLLSLK